MQRQRYDTDKPYDPYIYLPLPIKHARRASASYTKQLLDCSSAFETRNTHRRAGVRVRNERGASQLPIAASALLSRTYRDAVRGSSTAAAAASCGRTQEVRWEEWCTSVRCVTRRTLWRKCCHCSCWTPTPSRDIHRTLAECKKRSRSAL